MFPASVKALFQWTTVLPLGAPADFEAFARRSYLYPLAGWLIGGIVGAVIFFVPDRALAAAFALAGVLLLSGCNHFDGLLDLGDGVMAHGSREKRISALTDRQVGAGGVAFGLIFSLIAFAGLLSAGVPAYAILIAEVGAKVAMSVVTTFGSPFREGIQSFLHARSKRYFPFLSVLLFLPLFLLPMSTRAIAVAMVLSVVVPLVLVAISARLFGGVNGDVAGAANEITRAVILAALILA
jgi:adenosylcobinamide-GDP ribazoletransferase